MSDRSEIVIRLESKRASKRLNEPVTCGVPFPKGMVNDPNRLGMVDESGRLLPLQTHVLDRWSDGSARWVLCDWQATQTGPSTYRIKLGPPIPASADVACRVDLKHKTV